MVVPAHVHGRGSGAAGPRVIDALRRFAPAFLRQHATPASARSTLGLLLKCRTPALGGHRYTCFACGYSADQYNSCGNRHCSQCQAGRRARWVEAQQKLLLPVPHFQVVFTLPAELRPIARAFPAAIYDLLFRSAYETLKKLAATHWDATPAVLAVLHTWTRDLSFHPHVHCVVAAGGLDSEDRWVIVKPDFLFPHAAMQRLFRGIFLSRLTHLGLTLDRFQRHCLRRARKRAARKNWVVYIEVPDDRDPQHLVKYLARYVYQTAISDRRIVAVDADGVTLRTRGDETITLPGIEFVRRIAMHLLPKGFRRVRHYGLLAPGARARLRQARDITEHLPSRTPPRAEPTAHVEPDRVGVCLANRRCPTCSEPLDVHRLAPVPHLVVAAARSPP